LQGGATLPILAGGRRDFAVATLADDRVFIQTYLGRPTARSFTDSSGKVHAVFKEAGPGNWIMAIKI
jgi:hypothetical protein